MAEPFLIGEAMTGGYGGADILHACTIAVEKGQIAVIVGPNGAGKSTAMKAVFGMLKLRSGHVKLAGEDITALTPQARVGKGMAFVPQTSQHLHLDDGGGEPGNGGLHAHATTSAIRWRRSMTCSRS
jgi:ABC-type branched-subunit amino acid transport system ATPase component